MNTLTAQSPILLETQNIQKSFMGHVALGDVSFSLRGGECLALVGENGAGKSTLMKILSGVYKRDHGLIKIKGQEVQIGDPKAAQRLGISIIHQELQLIPDLTVYENIFLGREPGRAGIINDAKMIHETRKLLESIEVAIDPKSLVRQLTIAEQQVVEISKALSQNADIIIMDEPTASLSLTEVQQLFGIIHQLKREGKGIIYISHRLEELRVIAERICVLRDGTLVKELPCDAEVDEIIEHMVGRKITNLYPELNSEIGNCLLEVDNLSDSQMLSDVSMQIREGEVVGVSGLMGSGQIQLARALYGLTKRIKGEIRLEGQSYKNPSPQRSIRLGLGLVSEDRKDEGLVLGMSIASNTTLSNLESALNKFGMIDSRKENRIAEQYRGKLKIKSVNCSQEVILLSGGNQQKVVLAKVMLTNPKVIIMCEPTRGVDVNAKVEIYNLIDHFVREKKAVLLISSELPEILGLSHRVLVMDKGKIVAEFSHQEATQEKIMYYATGGNLIEGGAANDK
ncbi:sugar ABC transporter ATP-binding protein [Paenibacillus sp. TH7-28]